METVLLHILKKYLLQICFSLIAVFVAFGTFTYCIQFKNKSIEAGTLKGIKKLESGWFGGGQARSKYCVYEAFLITGDRVTLITKGDCLPVADVYQSKLILTKFSSIMSKYPKYEVIDNVPLFYSSRIVFGVFCLWIGLTAIYNIRKKLIKETNNL